MARSPGSSSMRDVIHRIVWSRLPHRQRRAAIFALTALVAAKADLDARPTEPIIVVGCLSSASGLGESARLCYEALRAAGMNVFGIDVSFVLMQPIDLPDYTYRDGRSMQ